MARSLHLQGVWETLGSHRVSSPSDSRSVMAAPENTNTPLHPNSPLPSVQHQVPIPEHFMHKNRLQAFAQRSNMSLPVYHTPNEGSSHAPRFRSTVLVDGKCYTSGTVFSTRKAAEQDVAKLAYEQLVTKIKDEGLPDIFEKTMFFKAILNEVAVKMNLDKATYQTVQQEGQLRFVSSLVFNGKSYIGDPSRSKKEAEQFAARTAILSNLNDSRLGTCLSEIINAKFKSCAASNNVRNSQDINANSFIASSGHMSISAALPEPSSRELQQEFLMSKQQKCPEDSKLSDLSQQAGEPRHIDDGSGLKKRKKNKKKANKKPRMDSLPPVAALPLNQAAPPVA